MYDNATNEDLKEVLSPYNRKYIFLRNHFVFLDISPNVFLWRT